MADIKAFLLPPVLEETREVIVTKRAKGPDGKAVPFVIRVIDQDTNDKIIKQATTRKKMNGQLVQELDGVKYGKLLIAACVVSPNFKDADLCAHYKVLDPLDVPGRMLNVGEYNRLVNAIKDLNEMAIDDEDVLALEDEVKNS